MALFRKHFEMGTMRKVHIQMGLFSYRKHLETGTVRWVHIETPERKTCSGYGCNRQARLFAHAACSRTKKKKV
jgi:hypothetical protein